MSKNIEILKERVNQINNKNSAIYNNVLALENFYNVADEQIKMFIDTLLCVHPYVVFHCEITDNKIIDDVHFCISIGNIVNSECFNSVLTSRISDPIITISSYKNNYPIFIIKDKAGRGVVDLNLENIKVVSICEERKNKNVRYLIQLHNNHFNMDYSIAITAKEDE